MRALWLISATTAVLLGSAPVLAQGKVGVFPVQGTNLSPGEGEAIGTVIAVSYATHSNANVLTPAQTADALAQNQGSEAPAARQLGLSQYIHVQAVRLGSRITLHATLYDQNGGLLYQAKTTATSMDDMEPVADRIASTLYRRTPLEETRTRRNVMGNESRAANRVFSEKVFGLRTGVTLPYARHLDTTAALSLEFDARLEAEKYFLEFAAGFMIPSSDEGDDVGIGALSAALGASYYLSDGDVAPYLGGGVSPRIMLGSYEGVGLTAHAQLGLMLMRWSSSRLYGELGIDQHLIGLKRSDSFVFENSTMVRTDRAWPTEFSLKVGIGW